MSFNIPDHNKENIPACELHYYHWLKSSKVTDIHSINTKKKYLESLGFIAGKNHISEQDLNLLKAIEQIFFNNELKNA